MKKILLLLLCITTYTLADYHFVVENATMVNSYFNVFNAIAAILNSDDYVSILRFIFLLGGFTAFMLVVSKSSTEAGPSVFAPYIKYLIGGVILLNLVYSKTDTMFVETKNIPSFCSISNSTDTGFAVELPSALGFAFSSINKAGRSLTELAETAFYTPSSTGTPSMTDNEGYLGSLKNAKLLLNMKVNDTITQGSTFDFNAIWSQFFSECVFQVLQNKGAKGNEELLALKTHKNLENWIPEFLEKNFVEGTNYPVKDNLIQVNGQHTTCGTFYEGLIKPSFANFKENLACALPTIHSGALELINKTPSNNISNIQEMAIQSGLVNAVENSLHFTKTGIAGVDYATGKTKSETNAQNLGAAAYMAEMLPYVQMTIRAILYAFFPFVFITILMPNGFKVLSQYGKTLLWIELWSPTAAIVNMFVNLQVQNSIGDTYVDKGLTVLTSLNMLSEANTIAGVGAMLYLSIPPLTWLILTGSAQMLGNIVGGVGANFTKNLESRAQAQDFAAKQAANKTGVNITEKEKIEAQKQAISNYSEAVAFEKVGNINGYYKTEQALQDGTLANNISKVANQNYVQNQKILGEQEAGANTGKIEAFLENGGIKAEEKLQYTNSDLAYKENKLLTDNFSNSQISSSNFENKKENIVKTLEQKSNFENAYGDTKNLYKMEGQQQGEDRKAYTRKLDLNGDGKITDKEQEIYKGDSVKKAMSEQNILKESNKRLDEMADMFSNSKNEDIKNTYNEAFKTYGDKTAAAAATLASIQTKEQSYNVEEKSEYLDTLNKSNIDVNDKGHQAALEDIKEINKKKENVAQQQEFLIDLNKDNYNKERAKELDNLGKELLDNAINNGVITNKDKALYKDRNIRLENINNIKDKIEKGDDGFFTKQTLKNEEEYLEKLNKQIDKIDLKVANFQNEKSDEITARYREKFKEMKAEKIDYTNLTDVKTAEVRGKNEGRKVETVGEDGREYTQIKDRKGNKITYTSKSQRGYENIGRFSYDALYFASDLTDGKHDEEIAIGKSVADSIPLVNKLIK
ncbi:conjugal transfer protein TraG N-terminal domain-containing protein [Aliarcobacter skirrowii]|uniref:conjugal transfer protein TraG N-terminal domain-containing protein n=1 Tax=Aliarcobacter skirrowii TaxID=28200 RepID=UPI000829E69F|nr:conjugal transfer protein TraG N-terminal domain-containing protein [Aliarcobacter skirrowii]